MMMLAMPSLALFLLLFPFIDMLFTLWLILEHSWLILILIGTSVLGIVMLRHHRLIILKTLINHMDKGQLATLFWIARYYVAAILLAFPGLLSDVLAVLFLIPWQGKVARPISSSDVIEAEFTRETSSTKHASGFEISPNDNTPATQDDTRPSEK